MILIFRCSSSAGYDSGPIKNNAGDFEYDDPTIKSYFNKKPQLKFPFKIAVMDISYHPEYQFTIQDKESFNQIEKPLSEKKIAQKIFFMDREILPEGQAVTGNRYLNYVKQARILAARFDADTVLILKNKVEVKASSNPLAIFYLTIVGMWIFPGSEREYKVTFNSALWDSRNEFLYAAAESEAIATVTRPLGWLNDRENVAKVKAEALEKIKKEWATRIENLKVK
jgi:rhombotail lipoprotein